MKKDFYVKVDSRNRVTIPKKIAGKLSHMYRISEKNGTITLVPTPTIPQEELWLFDPKNKHLVDELKKALKQKADRTIDLDGLKKK